MKFEIAKYIWDFHKGKLFEKIFFFPFFQKIPFNTDLYSIKKNYYIFILHTSVVCEGISIEFSPFEITSWIEDFFFDGDVDSVSHPLWLSDDFIVFEGETL